MATAYGVGVGPGDPDLLTLKAVRLIKENDVIAVPGKEPKASIAYKIAVQAVPELAEKQLLGLDMPMTKDPEKLREAHRKGAAQIEEQLQQGRNVVFLTLGDPTLYCTFSYIQHILEQDGYSVELVPGISSVMASAARLGISLTEWDEPLHIHPASHEEPDLSEKGTVVLMKSAGHLPEVKKALAQSGRDVQAVIDCGMETERLCRSLDDIPDDAGYFTLLIAKEPK